jgi:hypothetical protein
VQVRQPEVGKAGLVLTKAAPVRRLLGIEPVLPGIRAEVGETLVSIDIGLTGLVSRGTSSQHPVRTAPPWRAGD